MDQRPRRITVRHRLPRPGWPPPTGGPGPGGPGPAADRLADVVGTQVRGVGPGPTVRRDDGTLVSVRPERVLAVREHGPTVARSGAPVAAAADPVERAAARADDLDRLASRHWPATESVALGDWEMRAADGFTRRANSALAIGSPGRPLPTALTAVRDWYRTRGLVPMVSTADQAVVRAAGDAGWRAGVRNLVLTVRVADVLARLDDDWAGDAPPVELADSPDDTWLAAYRNADVHPAGRAVLGPPPGTAALFATVRSARSPAGAAGEAARGRVVVSQGWAGLSCVAVPAALRRRGLGRLVTLALLDAALDLGAVRAYLQVEQDNAPALALYRRLGLTGTRTTTYLTAGPP